MIKYYILLICFYFPFKVYSCTAIYSSKGDEVLAGSNKDWNVYQSKLCFKEAKNGSYGFVYCIIDKYVGGGMNERGLYYEETSLPIRNDIQFENKPSLSRSQFAEKLLGECKNIEDAVSFCQIYDLRWLNEHHLLIGDSTGNSVIIEWGEENLEIIHSQKSYQVMTNFFMADPDLARWYSCPRYKIACEMLENVDTISVDYFSTILNNVHQEDYPTVLSAIYNLKNKEIFYYQLHNFNEVFKIKLSEELFKGDRNIDFQTCFYNIFANKPEDNERICHETINFTWFGDALSYEIWIDKTSDFKNPRKEIYSSNQVSKASFGYLIFILLCIMLLGYLFPKRKIIVYSLCLMTIVFLNTCEYETIVLPDTKSKTQHILSINNLEPNTQYYWKIIAIGPDNLTENKVRSFFTIE